ncbi:hypothetical protein LSH36_756g00004, partial [Paralvinella palmiformis]
RNQIQDICLIIMAALKKIVHSFLLYFLLFTSLYYVASGKKKPNGNENDADKWKKKDIRDYTDADLERLYEQWELLQLTKKGRTLMMFATVSGNPDEKETETITSLWQSSLFNANYEIQRYIVGSNRVLLMLKDGSKAWEIKNFLVQQDRCEVVTIEGKDYYGKGSPLYKDPVDNDTTKKPKKKTEKTKSGMKVEL